MHSEEDARGKNGTDIIRLEHSGIIRSTSETIKSWCGLESSQSVHTTAAVKLSNMGGSLHSHSYHTVYQVLGALNNVPVSIKTSNDGKEQTNMDKFCVGQRATKKLRTATAVPVIVQYYHMRRL